ncbi:MAG: hypothetical protein FWG90_13160 [Oscillospiraceae bacterium]|nr:hypothetical protein [Oscillospiraceae bacterium]
MADYSNMSLQQLLIHKNDSEAWYQIGMAYVGNNKPVEAIEWLEKAVGVMEGDWKGKAEQELAIVYMADGHPKTNKREALRLFEKNRKRPNCNIFEGLMRYNYYKETQEGRSLVEKGIAGYSKYNLSFVDPLLLSEISKMYRDESEFGKAKEYLQQAVELCEAMGEHKLKSFIIQEAKK